MIIAAVIFWVLAAGAVTKLDAMISGEPSSKSGFIGFLILWPVGAVWLITIKHHVNNGVKDYYDY